MLLRTPVSLSTCQEGYKTTLSSCLCEGFFQKFTSAILVYADPNWLQSRSRETKFGCQCRSDFGCNLHLGRPVLAVNLGLVLVAGPTGFSCQSLFDFGCNLGLGRPVLAANLGPGRPHYIFFALDFYKWDKFGIVATVDHICFL